MSCHFPGGHCYRFCYQLTANNKPLVLSADTKRIQKEASSSADIPFLLPHILFNPAWFSTRPCERSLSSLQVVTQVDGNRRSAYDLTHRTYFSPFAFRILSPIPHCHLSHFKFQDSHSFPVSEVRLILSGLGSWAYSLQADTLEGQYSEGHRPISENVKDTHQMLRAEH